jgi:hypothetical protein
MLLLIDILVKFFFVFPVALMFIAVLGIMFSSVYNIYFTIVRFFTLFLFKKYVNEKYKEQLWLNHFWEYEHFSFLNCQPGTGIDSSRMQE